MFSCVSVVVPQKKKKKKDKTLCDFLSLSAQSSLKKQTFKLDKYIISSNSCSL